MATRIYLPNTGSAAISPAFGTWTETGGADVIKAVTTRISSTMTNKTRAHTATASGSTFLSRQYIFGPLAAQTIGVSTIKGTIRVYESAVNDNLDAMRLLVRVVSSDGSTYRSPVLYGPTNGTVAEFNNGSLRAKRLAVGGATASVTVTAGDYLVIEIGTTTTGGGVSLSDTISYGDNSGTDLGDNETDTAAYNPFVEIAATITMGAQAYTATAAASITSLAETAGRIVARVRAVADSCMGAYRDVVLADSPAAYWRLGEASGNPQDSSGNGRHVDAVGGSPTYGVTGALSGDSDKAITLNGSTGYFSVPDVGLDLGDVVSVEAWVYLTANPGAIATILGKGGNAYAVQVATDGFIYWRQSFGDIFAASGHVVPLNAWVHVVVTKNGSARYIYVNGADDTAAPGTDYTLADSAVALNIGREPSGADRFWPGSLDEVAVYGTVLSPTRVAAHYTAGTAPTGGLSESPSRIKGSPRTAADSVTSLVESVARGTKAWVRSGADSLASLSEDVARAIMAKARTAADSVASLGETPARLLVSARSAGDTISALSEAAVRAAAARVRTAADSVSSIAEAVVGVVGGGTHAFVATAADALSTLTEAANRAGVFARTSADSLPTLAEVVARAGVFARSGADSLSMLSEGVVRAAMAKARMTADSISTLTEVPTRLKSVVRTVAQDVGAIWDYLSEGGALVRTAADSVASLTETAVRGTGAWVRTGADSLASLTEGAVRAAMAKARTGADSLSTLTENVARAAMAKARTAGDSVATLAEAIGRAGVFGRTVADAVSAISEAVVAVKSGVQHLTATAADSVATITEAASRATQAWVRTSAASLSSLTETVSRAVMAKTRQAGDTIAALGETVDRVGVFGRTVAAVISAISESVVGTTIVPTIKGLAVAISSRIHQALTGNAAAPSSAATSVFVHQALSGNAAAPSTGAASDDALGDADTGDS